MLKFAICDDEAAERRKIFSMIQSVSARKPEYRFEAEEYASGEALLLDLEEIPSRFDLIILDIYMDQMNGMETARQIRKLKVETPLVFLTASPDFALESYDVHAAGYLLKPVAEEKLEELLGRLLTPPDRPRISIRCGRRTRYLFLEEIVYAESENHNIRLYLAGGEVCVSGEKLSSLEERLDGRFLRCHQSYLVNMDYIADVEEDFILKDGRKVPIRVRQHRAAADAYYRYFVKTTLNR